MSVLSSTLLSAQTSQQVTDVALMIADCARLLFQLSLHYLQISKLVIRSSGLFVFIIACLNVNYSI